MSAVEELMKEVAAAQKSELRRMDLLPEVQHLVAARMAEGTVKSRAESRGWRWVSLGTAAAAVAAVLLVVVSLQRAPFLTFTINDPGHFGQTGDLLAPPDGQATAAVFSDGSRVVVGERSNARIDSVDADGATVILDDGHLEASIVHRPRTRWEVRAGGYRIHVTGTRFTAAWNRREKALTVRLFEGSVEVTGPGVAATGARVRAGHVLHATAQGATLAAADAPASPATAIAQGPGDDRGDDRAADTEAEALPAAGTVAAPIIEPLPSAAAPTAPEAPAEAPPAAAPAPAPRVHRPMTRGGSTALPSPAPAVPAMGWRPLARRAQYHEALTLAVAEGFDSQCEQLHADDLVLLGDVARLGGDLKRADQAYRAALRRFPSLDRPAFALGVMSFEARHDYRDAAAWLSRYLRDHPNGTLATEAAGRLLEAWDLAGETTRARDAARSYLRDHPTGPHRALARRLAGP
jgi:ferric-dicitrate binding protein FerR (iron transport regulator)